MPKTGPGRDLMAELCASLAAAEERRAEIDDQIRNQLAKLDALAGVQPAETSVALSGNPTDFTVENADLNDPTN